MHFPEPRLIFGLSAASVADQDVVFAKLQRELAREREEVRGEAVAARYALLPQDDPARVAYKARGSTTALITLPNKLNCRSPRELVGDLRSAPGYHRHGVYAYLLRVSQVETGSRARPEGKLPQTTRLDCWCLQDGCSEYWEHRFKDVVYINIILY